MRDDDEALDHGFAEFTWHLMIEGGQWGLLSYLKM
jgi:hypothetical protein